MLLSLLWLSRRVYLASCEVLVKLPGCIWPIRNNAQEENHKRLPQSASLGSSRSSHWRCGRAPTNLSPHLTCVCSLRLFLGYSSPTIPDEDYSGRTLSGRHNASLHNKGI